MEMLINMNYIDAKVWIAKNGKIEDPYRSLTNSDVLTCIQNMYEKVRSGEWSK